MCIKDKKICDNKDNMNNIEINIGRSQRIKRICNENRVIVQ